MSDRKLEGYESIELIGSELAKSIGRGIPNGDGFIAAFNKGIEILGSELQNYDVARMLMHLLCSMVAGSNEAIHEHLAALAAEPAPSKRTGAAKGA